MSEQLTSDPLPIEAVLEQLRDALSHRHGVVLVAPPGAGKTTVVPLRLLQEPWLNDKRILILEPRRLAARAAARRMADLLGQQVGQTVGYQTRDERHISSNTRIEVLTEGILTRRLHTDPSLEGVGLVIFDEIHERNVPTDIGLALLLDARGTFDTDVRILAMSATPQAEKFSALLADTQGPAPVITSDGRSFPIDIRYVQRQRNDRLENIVSSTILDALKSDTGDVLVFLPGIGEINRVRDVLLPLVPPHVDVLRLAGALAFAEQDAALNASTGSRRRVVLSTDIAETSLTVSGIHIVVDAGLARTPKLDPRTGLTELVTVTSSRASADQRSGRAGRVAPGIAYRLWSRIEDSTRLAHLPAEITQVDLCGVALELAAWGTPLEHLKFLDAPPPRALRLAHDTLQMLHLLDHNTHVTELGHQTLRLPLHPRLATMVARSTGSDAWIACVISALLDDRDILRGRPDSLPTDLAQRVAIVLENEHHPDADRNGVRRIMERATDIARRANIEVDDSLTLEHIHTRVGALLVLAYPDRLAMRRATAGQFVLRSGGGTWMDAKDSLAHEQFIVAADLDGDRKSTRIRRAAALDANDVILALGDDVETTTVTEWDSKRSDVVTRTTRKVGSLVLDERIIATQPSPEVTAIVMRHIVINKLSPLNFDSDVRSLQQRIMFMRHHNSDAWPDVSDSALLATISDWLEPFLSGCTSNADLAHIDIGMALHALLSWDAGIELDTLAPAVFEPPTGRTVTIDYSEPGAPTIAIRVQSLFGLLTHPCVMNNAVALKVQLLSPADRPIQVTSDLPGFWTGSWSQVRKDMAGRYPKHPWPIDPTLR